MKRVEVSYALCSGCRLCEIACSLKVATGFARECYEKGLIRGQDLGGAKAMLAAVG